MINSKEILEHAFSEVVEALEGAKESKINIDAESHFNTPKRLSKMFLDELLIGYSQNPQEILSKQFDSKSDDMVIVKDISFVSLCAHHWLPFIGKCHVGYIPNNKKVVGLSKIPRLVNCFSRRFQIQENMTAEIADNLFLALNPAGCIVVCEASHLCAKIRGVQNEQVKMITSALRGCFEKEKVKKEFMQLIGI
jgi:GTP cyclohydrolase IA